MLEWKYSSRCWTILLLLVCLIRTDSFLVPGSFVPASTIQSTRQTLLVRMTKGVSSSREDEIRKKIMKLKRQGKIKKKDTTQESKPIDSDLTGDEAMYKVRENRQKLGKSISSDYDEKIKAKLGKKAAVKLGRFVGGGGGESGKGEKPRGSDEGIGLGRTDVVEDSVTEEEEDVRDSEEEQLVDFVAQKLAEKKQKEAEERERKLKESIADLQQKQLELETEKKSDVSASSSTKSSKAVSKTTSGVGGSWSKNQTSTDDTYRRPSRGSWGYFPRPKDISKTYGGGRRVGAGVTDDEDESIRIQSQESTRDKLRRYREKAGIEVQSEKDHAHEIEEALTLGQRAMQRGVYSTAVSCLEKVTKYCSTNSKLGGQIFLELAMAYEACGQSEEAITVYTTLSKSPIEEIKQNAKRLLYGIEAMNFMRNDLGRKDFSRQKIRNTYIDATGLANIADNFDVVYNTAYVDLDKGGSFYRKLTESVVRSNREARQVLLRAIGSGEVDRLRVVQALRSISRSFDEALKEEIKNSSPQEEKEPVAVMNGVPITRSASSSPIESTTLAGGMDQFVLASSSVMMENLEGEWRLQLMADKKGDGVNYYNTTLSWQTIDTSSKTFTFYGPTAGKFLTSIQKGSIEFNEQERVMIRNDVSSGNFLSSILSGSAKSGAAAAGLAAQQILSVDSVLCITRLADKRKEENVKDYFCVWRRVEPGTFSKEVKA